VAELLAMLSSSRNAEPLNPVLITPDVIVGVVNVLFVSICVPVNVATVESIATVRVLVAPVVSIPVPPAISSVSVSKSILSAPPESPWKSKSAAVT